jgi:hypothetical protein
MPGFQLKMHSTKKRGSGQETVWGQFELLEAAGYRNELPYITYTLGMKEQASNYVNVFGLAEMGHPGHPNHPSYQAHAPATTPKTYFEAYSFIPRVYVIYESSFL